MRIRVRIVSINSKEVAPPFLGLGTLRHVRMIRMIGSALLPCCPLTARPLLSPFFQLSYKTKRENQDSSRTSFDPGAARHLFQPLFFSLLQLLPPRVCAFRSLGCIAPPEILTSPFFSTREYTYPCATQVPFPFSLLLFFSHPNSPYSCCRVIKFAKYTRCAASILPSSSAASAATPRSAIPPHFIISHGLHSLKNSAFQLHLFAVRELLRLPRLASAAFFEIPDQCNVAG